MVGVIDRAYLAISADKEIARLVSRPHEKCHGHIVAEDDIEVIDLILAVGDIRVIRFPKKIETVETEVFGIAQYRRLKTPVVAVENQRQTNNVETIIGIGEHRAIDKGADLKIRGFPVSLSPAAQIQTLIVPSDPIEPPVIYSCVPSFIISCIVTVPCIPYPWIQLRRRIIESEVRSAPPAEAPHNHIGWNVPY